MAEVASNRSHTAKLSDQAIALDPLGPLRFLSNSFEAPHRLNRAVNWRWSLLKTTNNLVVRGVFRSARNKRLRTIQLRVHLNFFELLRTLNKFRKNF